MFDITHGGRTTLRVDRESALALGYPEAAIAKAEFGVRRKIVTTECRRRIYAVASVESQMNMAAACAVFSAKTASARTETEKAVLTGLEAAIGWVSAMRAAAAELAVDAEKDFTADEHWPDVPAVAAAIAGQF